MNKNTLIVIVISVLGALAGGYYGLQHTHDSQKTGPATLSDLRLPDVDKQLREGKEWEGKVVVVNHWATWCPPCREEIPMLIDYQERMEQQGIQIIGVAHDTLEKTRIFGDQIGIDYPSLVAIAGGTELLMSHGNTHSGALPYTVVFDRSGAIAGSKMGKIDAAELDQLVKPLL